MFFNTTNTNKNTSATTYVKNMRVDYEDSVPTNYNTVVMDGKSYNVTTNSTSKALSVPSRGLSTEKLQTSSNSEGHFETNNKTPYTNVEYAKENGALKVTLTPPTTGNNTRHAIIQNFKSDITSYFPAGTNFMEISYDIKIPADSVSATREQYWRIGNDTEATNTSVYTIGSRIKDGILYFYNDAESYNGDETTRKSAPFTITPDKWYRIITLLKVTNSGTDYVLHTEGYVEDITTDNLPADATDIFNIEVNCHDGKNAVAKARKVEGITNEKLILAAYDANNKLVGIKVSTASDIDVNDEQFVKVGLDITGKGAKKLKAFFFDGISSLKSIIKNAKFVIK